MNSLELQFSGAADQAACQLCLGKRLALLAERGSQRLLRCFECGGIFVSPQPDPIAIAVHFQEPELDEEALQRRFEQNRENVLAKVASYVARRRTGGRIVDVGCATGLFLRRFFRREEWESWGIDLNLAEVRCAQKNGVRTYHGTLREACFDDSFFDVVTVLDAFYYFPHPEEELSEVRRSLKPDGLLVIELPLATSRIWGASTALGRLLKGRRKSLLDTSDHLYYFTPQSISRLLQRCGFRVDSIFRLPGNRQETLRRRMVFGAYYFISAFLERVSGGAIFLGPRFFVVASKDRPR